MLPPQGGLPPSLSPAPANAGPATMPQGNQGNVAMAMIDVRNALGMLQKALPMIPMGSEIHTDILEAMKKVSKHLGQGSENQGLQLQSLLQLAKNSAQQAPLQALSKLYPGAGPGTPPAMPQPQPPAPAEAA